MCEYPENTEELDLFPEEKLPGNIDVHLADMPEVLDNPTLSKYIVAFFREKDETHWCGNGVIVGNLLITVAHVMMEKKEPLPYLFFRFENCIRRVDEKDIIYDGRKELDKDLDHIHHDLIVFKLSNIASPFVLNTTDFDISSFFYARKYMEQKKSTSLSTYKILMKKGFKNDRKLWLKKESFEWNNCFLTTGDFIKGDSGTAIYRENIVYGILIGRTVHPNYSLKDKIFNFLDARYIQETISKWFSHN